MYLYYKICLCNVLFLLFLLFKAAVRVVCQINNIVFYECASICATNCVCARVCLLHFKIARLMAEIVFGKRFLRISAATTLEKF